MKVQGGLFNTFCELVVVEVLGDTVKDIQSAKKSPASVRKSKNAEFVWRGLSPG